MANNQIQPGDPTKTGLILKLLQGQIADGFQLKDYIGNILFRIDKDGILHVAAGQSGINAIFTIIDSTDDLPAAGPLSLLPEGSSYWVKNDPDDTKNGLYVIEDVGLGNVLEHYTADNFWDTNHNGRVDNADVAYSLAVGTLVDGLLHILKIARGTRAEYNAEGDLYQGELYFITDTEQVVIGTGTGNILANGLKTGTSMPAAANYMPYTLFYRTDTQELYYRNPAAASWIKIMNNPIFNNVTLNNLFASGDVEIAGTLDVTGEGHFYMNLDVDGDMSAGDDLIVGDDLTVGGDGFISGDLQVTHVEVSGTPTLANHLIPIWYLQDYTENMQQNLAYLNFQRMVDNADTLFGMIDGFVDQYQDDSGIDGAQTSGFTLSSTGIDNPYVYTTSTTGTTGVNELVSIEVEAAEEPTELLFLTMVQTVVGIEVTLNDELKAYISVDDGTNWEQITLEQKYPDMSSTYKVYGGINRSFPVRSDKTIRYRLTVARDKEIRVYGSAAQWA